MLPALFLINSISSWGLAVYNGNSLNLNFAPDSPTIVEVQINNGNDDCVFYWNDKSWAQDGLAYAGLYTGYVDSEDCKEGVALRWASVAVPPGVLVSNCHISMCANNYLSTVTVNSKITGAKELNAASWSDLANYQPRRGTVVGGTDNSKITSAQTAWNNIGAWSGNIWYDTPDISPIIHEIINQPGWKSGNPIALFWDDHEGLSTAKNRTYRGIYSWNADHSRAAKLHIEYTANAPVYNITASVSGGHGSISPASQQVNRGGNAYVTITPENSYHIASISDNNTPVTSLTSPYTISNVISNHTVVVTFAQGTSPTPTTHPPVYSGGGGYSPPLKDNTLSLTGLTSTPELLTDNGGISLKTVHLEGKNGNITLDIDKGTLLQDANGNVLKIISATTISSPPSPSADSFILIDYVLGPSGAKINPQLTLSLQYDPQSLPLAVDENKILLASWDGVKWTLLDSNLNKETHTVSARISLFSQYALLAKYKEASFFLSGLKITKETSANGQLVRVQVTVSNTGGIGGKYELTLNLNGNKVDQKEITLEAGKQDTSVFQLQDLTPGKYTVSINGTTGQFTLEDPLSAVTETPALPAPQTTQKAVDAPVPVPLQPEIPSIISTVETQTPLKDSNRAMPVMWIIIGSVAAALIAGILVFRSRMRNR